MNENSDVIVQLEGFTDSTGSPEFNMKLSEKRALAVKEEMMKLGVEEDRIFIKYYGVGYPCRRNEKDDLRNLNRRVEFITKFK